MNIFKKYLISIFLFVLLMNSAYGFAGMDGNTTAVSQDISIETQLDLKNATNSDQDIIMAQHLIEYDALQLQSENKIFIRETLIFRNNGVKDYYGPLKTWLAEGSEGIKVSKSEMMTGGGLIPIESARDGNIISWQEYVEKNSPLPLLYVVEYIVPMESGASSITGTFSKKLGFPTQINYRYVEKPGLPGLVIKITKPQESSIKIIDENRDEITSGEMDEAGDIIRFSSPQFKELNIKISGTSAIPAIKNDYLVYIGLGILILLVLLYPMIKNKFISGDNDGNEDNKRQKATSRQVEEEPEQKRPESDACKRLLQELNELEAEYKTGDLLDEEYEDKKNSIQKKLKAIK